MRQVDAAATSVSPEGIVVPAESPIQDAAELAGATIGVASDEERTLVAAALQDSGGSIDDVTLVNVGGGGQVIANELERGQFDAFAGSVLDFSAVQAIGYELRDITPASLAATPSGAFVVGEDADADATAAFLRAVSRATAWGLENPDELEAMLRERVPEEWENEDVARTLFEFGIDVWSPREGGQYGALVPEVWQDAVERASASGELVGEVDLARLRDDQYLPVGDGATGSGQGS